MISLAMMQKYRSAVVGSILFFLVLSCWAFAGPIGAGGDSDFHISSIWCGQGPRKGLCEDRGMYETGYQAKVPFMFQMCDGRPIEFLPRCAVINSKPEMQFLRTASPPNQNAYYKIMSYVVSKNTHQSILKIRLINAFISSLVLCSLLIICRSKIRSAVIVSWSIGLIPVGVQFLSSINPRGWSYLAVFSSWAFLATGLEQKRNSMQRSAAFILCAVTSSLAFATRIDASLFVTFSCSLVAISYFLKAYSVSRKVINVSLVALIALAVLIRSISRLSDLISFPMPHSISGLRYFLLQLVHGPEFIAQAWGYSIGQQGNGPGIIGIVGLGIFFISLAFSLKNATQIQVSGVIAIAVFLFMAHIRGSLSIGELVPASGEYVMALTVFLLGYAIWTSSSKEFFHSSRGGRVTSISLLTFTHAIALYSYMEFYVKRGNEVGSFKTISLKQSWWWDTGFSPNAVYWMGSVAFALCLLIIWSMINQPVMDEH